MNDKKIGLKTAAPNVSVQKAPGPKRALEYWVNDVRSTVGRLNVQLSKSHQLGIRVALKLEVGANGEPVVIIESAVIP